MIEEGSSPCIIHYDEAVNLSSLVNTTEVVKRRSIRDFLFREGSVLSTILGPTIRKREALMTHHAESWLHQDLNLVPGEVVEVRSHREIRATLDRNGATRGLSFMPEMESFCGRQFKVAKRVRRIVMESTGELREMKIPAVLLEGAACDGAAHHGCDRSCPCFWREQWLKRIP
jgi:hypothetical protein